MLTDEAASTRREHKRTKMWGKKNKKLRNKNPYDEESGAVSYSAYSTNRNLAGPAGGKGEKLKRHNTTQAYGTPFTRTTLPHYQNKAPEELTRRRRNAADSSSSSASAVE